MLLVSINTTNMSFGPLKNKLMKNVPAKFLFFKIVMGPAFWMIWHIFADVTLADCTEVIHVAFKLIKIFKK